MACHIYGRKTTNRVERLGYVVYVVGKRFGFLWRATNMIIKSPFMLES